MHPWNSGRFPHIYHRNCLVSAHSLKVAVNFSVCKFAAFLFADRRKKSPAATSEASEVLQDQSALDCARACDSRGAGCKSFTYIQTNRRCLLYTSPGAGEFKSSDTI